MTEDDIAKLIVKPLVWKEHFPTLAVAQAAAEADYRARIAAALDLAPVVALVEAARRASHATIGGGLAGRIYTDEAIALQRALAPFTKDRTDGQ